MNRLLLSLMLTIGICTTSTAQYTLAGKIEYEKKMNIHAQLKEWSDDDNDPWYERVKNQTPRFNTTYFEMMFDTARAIYKPGKEGDPMPGSFRNRPATDNTVLTDFTSQKVKAAKNIYEEKFVVQDTMRKLEWKVKDEIRTISNYKCRKAVAKILDSVYVVAFYTEDIPLSGGPEMFGGLPGMILELAIPRLHTTWTATKIESVMPADKDFAISEKGKKVTEKELYDILVSSLKDWGKWGTKNIWWSVL